MANIKRAKIFVVYLGPLPSEGVEGEMKGIGGAGRKAILQQLGGYGPSDESEDKDGAVNRAVNVS